MIARVVRVVLVLAAAATIACQTELGARFFPYLIPLNIAVFVVAVAAGRWAPAAARWIVLLPACLFPAMLLEYYGHFDPPLFSVWMAALLGLIVGTSGWSRWSMPVAWRWPLTLWGLCVAGSWPIVAWRELDYTWAQLARDSTAVTRIGIPPSVEIVWIANVAATHLIGILWFDALCAERERDPGRAPRGILTPLLASAFVSAVVALYQMFGHLTLFNANIFAYGGRASGTMVDGNAFGMAAALAIGGSIALGWSTRILWRRVAAAIAAGVLAGGVWSSGSQSAFFVVGVTSAGILYAWWAWWRTSRRLSWRQSLGLLTAGAVLVGIVAVAGQRTNTIGPLKRFSLFLSAAPNRGGVLASLWGRDGYGTASTATVARFPWTGVGIGMFNSFVIDESQLVGYPINEPDNAQNWFRHQIAEMGVVGSLGWIVWVALFVLTLFRKPPPEAPGVSLYVLRAAMIGLGLASQIAMPTQNVVVLVTFWTFVYWHTRACGLLTSSTASSTAGSVRWIAAVALAGIYCACVAWVGASALRVPLRAEIAGWPYDRGLYDLETPAAAPGFRWTGQHAVAVFPAPKEDGYFELKFWVHHPDVATRPVHVRIWVRGRLVVDMTVATADPVARYIHVHPGEPSLMIEATVDRTWQPSSEGSDDHRALGIALQDWRFTCCPPPGAIRVD